jgi:hypothetical protein
MCTSDSSRFLEIAGVHANEPRHDRGVELVSLHARRDQ